jgi:NAD(P)-dependent dehydrogenase (short-subunit alcohol dehydrogenase family)
MNANSEASLEGQVAVVTGAGRGIGAAIALRLASLGATVVLCGRTLKTLQTTAAAIAEDGGRSEAMSCDVSDLASVQALAVKVEERFGRMDILVNNAGIGGFAGPLHEMTPEAWEKIINTILR